MIKFSDHSKLVYAYDAKGKKLRAEHHTPIQPYKYNGKELDRHHGLDWYDYGARWYNGYSWMTPDPHAESYYDVTPYGYCHDNPVNKIDPNGKDDYYTSSGQFLFRDQKETDNIIIRNQFLYYVKSITDAEWIKPDIPIENMVLSAEAYSNIFPKVLLEMSGSDKVDRLYNNMVSVGVTFCDEDIKSQYNSPVLREGDNAITERVGTNIKVSAKVNHGGNGDNRFLFSTVSNIQNLLGIHEYKGHGIKNGGMQIINIMMYICFK